MIKPLIFEGSQNLVKIVLESESTVNREYLENNKITLSFNHNP